MGLSGEEQGLWGGQIVARHAVANDWNIAGVLNNDMIGNIEGISGVIENMTARVFSDPTPMSDAVRERVDNSLATVRLLASGETVMEGDEPLTLDQALDRVR